MKQFARLLIVLICGLAAPVYAQVQDEIHGMFNFFVRESNTRNVGAVGQMLLDSQEFSWEAPDAPVIKGRDAALQYLSTAFQGSWRVEPDMKAMTITPVAPERVKLQVPVRYSTGAPGKTANSESCLLTQTYIKTTLGWRIATLALTPLTR